MAEFSNAVDEESDSFAELGFDVVKSYRSIFDGVVENAGDDSVFIHVPFFEDLFHSEGVDNIGLAGAAELISVSFSGEIDGGLNTRGRNRGNFMFFVHYGIIVA